MRMNSVVRLALLLSVAWFSGRTAEPGIALDTAAAQTNPQPGSLPTAESGQSITVESPDVSICDSDTQPESAPWIQLQKCGVTDAKKIIAWPLFSFPDGKNPQAMQFEKCLSNSRVSCGFDASPKNWWIGPVMQGDPDLMPNPANIKLSKNPLSQPEFQSRKDQLNGLLFYLETQMAPVELAWRLGESNDPDNPIFSLKQGADKSQTIYLGNCSSLWLGRVKIRGIIVNLKSECVLHGAGADRIFRDAATQSSHYFHWKLEEDDPNLMTPVDAGDSAEFVLFPYNIAAFEENGVKLHRKGVPVHAESDSFLVSLHTPLVVIPPPLTEKHGISAVEMILCGSTVLLFVLFLRLKRNAALPSLATQPIRAIPRPAVPGAARQIEIAPQPPDVCPDTENPVQTREETLARIQSVIERLGGIEGSLRKLEDASKRCAQELENARGAAKVIENRMKHFETRSTDLESRVTGFAKRLEDTSTHVGSMDARLRKEIDSRIEQAALEWSSMILFDPASPPALPMSQGAAQGVGVEADVEKVLRPMYEFSNFALEILRAWLAVNPVSNGNIERDEFGKSLSTDLKVLEAIVHLERPLWSWWLGKLPYSNAVNIVVRVATNKWSSIPTTQQDAARLALQWADDRVPRIQTLIEAAPLECGSHDPAGLRKALIKAASRLSGSTDDDDEVISLSKISKVFHALVENIYSAAGAQYVAVRLYHDTIQSHDIPHFIEETHAAYAFSHSDLLVDKGVADRHGLVVRITQPLSKRRDRSSGRSKWEGSLYFLETRKPNA